MSVQLEPEICKVLPRICRTELQCSMNIADCLSLPRIWLFHRCDLFVMISLFLSASFSLLLSPCLWNQNTCIPYRCFNFCYYYINIIQNIFTKLRPTTTFSTPTKFEWNFALECCLCWLDWLLNNAGGKCWWKMHSHRPSLHFNRTKQTLPRQNGARGRGTIMFKVVPHLSHLQ